MVHITEENVIIVDCELLIKECIKANDGKLAFVYLISPFMTNFRIPKTLTTFYSNFLNISDIVFFSDLVRMLANYGCTIYILTKPLTNQDNTNLNKWYFDNHSDLIDIYKAMKAKIRYNSNLHAKATITSQGVLVGSFNLTTSGRYYNIETGNYFSNSSGIEKEEYQKKLDWGISIYNASVKP